MPHVLVRKSYYDEGWSSVDNPYGPGGYAYDGPPIPVEEPPPRGPRKLRQSILPEFDPTLDETTGYAGVPPVSALRYMGDFTAGSPVEQGDYQTSFEGTGDSELGLPKRQPDVDFNAPTVDAPHGEPAPTGWKNRPPTDADADFGYPDKGGWLYRDPNTGSHYWYKNGNKIFMDVREGVQGSWWSRPDMQNFSRAAGSAMNPTKVLALRGDPSNYGRPSMRDSDEAPERLAEMFLQHDKNIPPEMLVEFPIRENVPGVRNETYIDTARRMGTPEGIHPRFGVTRWSNAPLPFNTPNLPANKPRTLDDMTEEELYRDILDEYKQTGEPMEIAFQLLKAGNVGSVRGMGSGATDNIYHYPHELDYDSMTSYMSGNPNATLGDMVSPYLQGQFTNNPSTNPPAYQSQAQTQFQNTVPAPFPQTPEQTQGVQQLIDEGFDDYQSRDSTRKPHYDSMNNAVRVLSRNLRANPAFDFAPPGRLRGVRGRNKSTGRTREMQNMKLRSMLDTPVSLATTTMTPEQGIPIAAGEPMNIAFRLLKERKSPEAMRRKKEYDTKYESSPERVKYREELNRERKRRGIYGSHDHMDVSHTQGGRLTLEGEHANRARHFKNRGTLRRVRVR